MHSDYVVVMMKIFQILNGSVHYELTGQFDNAEDARKAFSDDIKIVDAPNHVFVGWGFDGSKSGDARFIKPDAPEGCIYDPETGVVINIIEERSMERIAKHQNTINDTMQALRKIREGDTSMDWSKWLDMLDAYNVAIEETKNQKDYPLKVVYPEYPTKPTK